jgi:hypothetical protein
VTSRPDHAPKHPDFEAGNALALKSGAYSPRAIAEKAAHVHQELVLVAPWLDQPQYAPSLLRYLQATAREQLAHKALVDSPKFSPRALEAATAAARLAWAMGDSLGLTPAGHARLRALMADAVGAEVSIADLAERGRLIMARRDAEFAEQQEHLDGLQSGEGVETAELVP